MPRMNGVELVKRVPEMEFRGKILVLCVHLSPENRGAYKEFGVDGMMPKPFDLFQLRDLSGRIVRGEAPPVSEQVDPFHASHTELYILLRLVFSEEDAPVEPAD